MFKENKYHRWYFNIINRAKIRTITGYYETHHIVPKSLGGDDLAENLVKLTAREHFICHWLLTKFVIQHREKTDYALWLMMNVENCNQVRYKINSKIYEILKIKLSKTFKTQQLGKKLSEETKKKISETRKRKIKEGTLVVNVNKSKYKIISEKRKGKQHSEITKKKIGLAHSGKKLSEEQKATLSLLNTGKEWSMSSKQKLSNTLKEQYANGDREPAKGMLGKKLSEQAKEKISNALRGKSKPPRTEEYKQAQSRRIKDWWAERKKANG